ncbi:MAG: transposase [Myxococcota bacterium]
MFHSCRNRHCPQCQALTQARSLEGGLLERLLPIDYFHGVFTVPDELLAGLAIRNREIFFDAMFAAGSQTLLALGNDEKRLGAQLGLTHDGRLEVRGVEGLGDAADPDTAWRRLRRKLYRTKWVSYAKPPFAGPESVYQYLGRYTHRVGLSNHRLTSVTGEAVTFRTRGDQTATLHPHEFLRRFLLHVLPHGYVKLRHYGLLAPGNVNTKLVTARSLLLRLVGIDLTRCQKCGGEIASRPLAAPPLRDTS